MIQARAYNQSRVKLYLRCRQAYDFRYDYPIRELGAKTGELVRKHPSLPLKKGSWMHELQQAHWLEVAGVGKGWKKRHKKLTKNFDKLFDEEKDKYGPDLPGECERLFRGYLRRWEGDEDRFQVARLSDGRPAVEFVIEMDLSGYGVRAPFKGRIDLLVEDREHGGLWIRDGKWVGKIPDPDERMMSPQNILYVKAGQANGLDIRGFIYDYGRTKSPTDPRILKSTTRYGPAGSVSLASSDTSYEVYLAAIKRAHGSDWKLMARTRYRERLQDLRARDVLWYSRERIPVSGPRVEQGVKEFVRAVKEIERRGKPIRTYLYNCRWNCDFHEPCVAAFQGLDIEEMISRQYEIQGERYTNEDVN